MEVKCGLDDGAVDDQVTKHDYCKTLFRHTRRIIVDSASTYTFRIPNRVYIMMPLQSRAA